MTPYPGFFLNVLDGSRTRVGWTVGLGLEYAFTPALSAKAEYDFLDFGSTTASLSDPFGNVSNVAVSSHAHLIKLGLNYRLGEGIPFFAATGAVPSFALAAAPAGNRNWTGFYVGAHAGGGWGRTDWDSADGVFQSLADSVLAGSGDAAGMLGGVQAGYNFQAGRWVIGVEAGQPVGHRQQRQMRGQRYPWARASPATPVSTRSAR